MKKFLSFLRCLLIGWVAIVVIFSIGSGFIHWDVQAFRVSEWGGPWRLLCFGSMVYWLWIGVQADYL